MAAAELLGRAEELTALERLFEYRGPLVPVNELVEHLGSALDFLNEDGISLHLALSCNR